MQFTIPQPDLSRALSLVLGSAETKGAMPILSTVRIAASDGVATFTCSDLTIATTASAPCDVVVAGSICVDAKKLAEIAKTLPKGEVSVEVEASGVSIRAGKRRFALPMLDAADYPPTPTAPPKGGGVVFPAETLRILLTQTSASVSTDDTRPHLACVLVECGGGKVVAVSTDGHRLTLAELILDGALRVQIPAKGAGQIRALADRGNPVTVAVASPWMFASTSDVTVAAKLVEATFPAYEQVVPKGPFTTTATVKRAALLDMVRAVSLVSSDRTSGVRLRFAASGTLTLDAENPDTGTACDEMPVDLEGAPLSIGANAKYLVDALSALGDEGDVRIECGGELDPMKLSGGGVTCVVMPMRI